MNFEGHSMLSSVMFNDRWHINPYSVCIGDADDLLLLMLPYSIGFLLSSYSTFQTKFTQASALWKQPWSNSKFNTISRIIWIRGGIFLVIWVFGAINDFWQRPTIHCSNNGFPDRRWRYDVSVNTLLLPTMVCILEWKCSATQAINFTAWP